MDYGSRTDTGLITTDESNHITFDSINFLILTIRCDAFDSYLKSRDLNASQYATLLLLFQNRRLGRSTSLSDLASFLCVSSAAATQTVNSLCQKGYASKQIISEDARAKTVYITSQGEAFLKQSDKDLHEWLSTQFKPKSPAEAAQFEAGLRIGARVGDHWEKDVIELLPHATNLVSVNLFLRLARLAIREAAAISTTEGRLMQLLWEKDQMLRIAEAAQYLRLPAASITLAAQKLSREGLIERLASPDNKRAVYLQLTEKGRVIAEAVESSLFDLGENLYWGQLSQKEVQATLTIRKTIIDSLFSVDSGPVPGSLIHLDS